MRTVDTENSKARRTAIREAAFVCFASKGFHGTSMRDIAGQAGVSLGLLYRYFSNKDALIADVIQTDIGEFRERLDRLRDRAPSVADFEAFLRSEVALRAEPITFQITSEIVAEAARRPALTEALRQNLVDAELAIQEFLVERSGHWNFSAGPEQSKRSAMMILSFLEHNVTRAFLGIGEGGEETTSYALQRLRE